MTILEQEEQGGEGRDKMLYLKNALGTAKGVGQTLRDLAVSGTGGPPIL